MLHDIYLDAIKNREDKISGISLDLNRNIFGKAQELWKEYKPLSRGSMLVGVDSSYNKHNFQGFYLYVIDAVCVRLDGSIIAKKYESKIRVIDQRQFEAKSMWMESEVAAQAADTSDLVLIDGSLIARFILASSAAIRSALDLIYKHSNIIFISKTSDSREIFDRMNSKVGDIYYFNCISNKAGYSRPYHITRYEEKCGRPVTVVFARLSDYTPLIKLEFPKEVDETDVQRTIDQIAFQSVSGYPYVLKTAHNTAVITDADVKRLVSIYGLKNEISAREVLK